MRSVGYRALWHSLSAALKVQILVGAFLIVSGALLLVGYARTSVDEPILTFVNQEFEFSPVFPGHGVDQSFTGVEAELAGAEMRAHTVGATPGEIEVRLIDTATGAILREAR